jgi:1-acyl-sn-glycerol-3-phosphate acyltransferase
VKAALASLAGACLVLFARFLTAVRAVWQGVDPLPGQRVYFANHTSNGDLVLIWTVLPPALRARTRPVAASDYWLTSPLRRFVGTQVFRAVLIDRRPEHRETDPMQAILAALDEGASLILFPEGKRNLTDAPLLPFRSGLYNIAQKRPGVDLVPVWIENLNRVMPKGKLVPIPLLCTVTFGAPLRAGTDEPREAFLARAAAALQSLAPPPEPA